MYQGWASCQEPSSSSGTRLEESSSSWMRPDRTSPSDETRAPRDDARCRSQRYAAENDYGDCRNEAGVASGSRFADERTDCCPTWNQPPDTEPTVSPEEPPDRTDSESEVTYCLLEDRAAGDSEPSRPDTSEYPKRTFDSSYRNLLARNCPRYPDSPDVERPPSLTDSTFSSEDTRPAPDKPSPVHLPDRTVIRRTDHSYNPTVTNMQKT